MTGTAENTSADLQGDTRTTTRTAIGRAPRAGPVMTPRRADARLAPGGPNGPRERDAPAPAGQAARWQLVLDLLDPDNRCGALVAGHRPRAPGGLHPRPPPRARGARQRRNRMALARRTVLTASLTELRTGQWYPMAARRPSRDSRCGVTSNQCGAAGWHLGPADPKAARDE